MPVTPPANAIVVSWSVADELVMSPRIGSGYVPQTTTSTLTMAILAS